MFGSLLVQYLRCIWTTHNDIMQQRSVHRRVQRNIKDDHAQESIPPTPHGRGQSLERRGVATFPSYPYSIHTFHHFSGSAVHEAHLHETLGTRGRRHLVAMLTHGASSHVSLIATVTRAIHTQHQVKALEYICQTTSVHCELHTATLNMSLKSHTYAPIKLHSSHIIPPPMPDAPSTNTMLAMTRTATNTGNAHADKSAECKQ